MSREAAIQRRLVQERRVSEVGANVNRFNGAARTGSRPPLQTWGLRTAGSRALRAMWSIVA
jgi:hypothetical protein